MLDQLLTTSAAHSGIATIAMLGGLAFLPALRFVQLLLTRQAVVATVEQTAGSEQTIHAEVVHHRLKRSDVEAPVVRRMVRAVYTVDGHRYVRDMMINVVAREPSPRQLTLWYRPDEPGSPATSAIAYGTGSALAMLACAVLAWMGTMALYQL